MRSGDGDEQRRRETIDLDLANGEPGLGVTDVFSVPGDFHLALLDHLIAEPGLTLVGCCNELNVFSIPGDFNRKTAASYRELEARKARVNDLEKLYKDMALGKELQKKGRKRKLREDEIVCPTSKRVYKWRSERKR